MKPPGHAVVSLAIGGALWAVTQSPYALLGGVVTGVAIDLDHLVEYYRWLVKEDHTRVYYFLHSYELVPPAFLAGYFTGWEPAVLGVSVAFLGHLFTDQLANATRPFTYFFTYRAMKRFRHSEIFRVEDEELRRESLNMPFAKTVLAALNPRSRSPNKEQP